MEQAILKAKKAATGFKDPEMRARALERSLGLQGLSAVPPSSTGGGWTYVHGGTPYNSIVRLVRAVGGKRKREDDAEEEAAGMLLCMQGPGAGTVCTKDVPKKSRSVASDFYRFADDNKLLFETETDLAAGLRRFMVSSGCTPLEIKGSYNEIRTVCLDDEFLRFLAGK